MRVYLVRHAETDATRLTRDDFGPKGAPINSTGVKSSKKLGIKINELGIDKIQPVVVSELQRTHQTAKAAGFNNVVINPLLNEINTGDIKKTLELVRNRQVPEEAKEAARKILVNPPKEKFWFTHGLVSAALLDELGYVNRKDYIPEYAELVEIEI